MKEHKHIFYQTFLVLILIVATAGFERVWPQHQKLSSYCLDPVHYAYFSTKSFYDEAYKKADTHDFPSGIKAITLNHHLLAPHLIAESINAITTTERATVVLVSPNHFSAGQGQIISSAYGWDTPYGKLLSDCVSIEKLKKMGVLSVEEKPFVREHGVSGIVAFIKHSIPNAHFIPLIVKETTSEAELNNMVKAIGAVLPPPVLIIGSFDFSHYVPASVAMSQDQKSIEIIRNFDLAHFSDIHVDSVKGLKLFIELAKQEGASGFTLLKNTNSAEVTHDTSNPEVTSYINGFFR